jgi:hypothetical protein
MMIFDATLPWQAVYHPAVYIVEMCVPGFVFVPPARAPGWRLMVYKNTKPIEARVQAGAEYPDTKVIFSEYF